MRLSVLLSTLAAALLVACGAPSVDVPAPEAGMPPPDGANAAPSSTVGAAEGGAGDGADDHFGKEEYIDIMADFLCADRAHPKGDARDAARKAVVAKYGFAEELLEQTEADLKKEKEVHRQMQVKIAAAADEVCAADGTPLVSAAPDDEEGAGEEKPLGDAEEDQPTP